MWHVSDPARLIKEREAIANLVTANPNIHPGDWRFDPKTLRLVWDADIHANGKVFEMSLIYPNHFPLSPPTAIPRENSQRWSAEHQYTDGSLCLEVGGDNWQPDFTGADMVASAARLVTLESSDDAAPIPSRELLTLGQEIRSEAIRFYERADANAFFKTVPIGISCAGTMKFWQNANTCIVVLNTANLGTEEWKAVQLPKVVIDISVVVPVTIIKMAEPAPEITYAFLQDYIKKSWGGSTDPVLERYVLIITETTLRLYLLDQKAERASLFGAIPYSTPSERLDAGHAALREKSAAIIGCGSLGSKVAAILARSGVGKFFLIDDEVLLEENLVRNDLDMRDIGCHKAEAVAQKLKILNPDVSVKFRRTRVGGQEATTVIETMLDTLSKFDLIIDATANSKVFNFASAASVTGKKAMIWTEIYAGGVGGMIARHRPGIDPDPQFMRTQIDDWCRDYGMPVEVSRENYALQTAGGPLIADDADVTVIAGHTARFAIDVLIGRNPSMFPNSVYMIGLAEHWIFQQPFDTMPITLSSPVNESPPKLLSEEEIAEHRLFIGELLVKLTDESAA